MNLISALEKNKALLSLIDDKVLSIKNSLYDIEKLSDILTEIDGFIDEYYKTERSIDKYYNEIKISQTETISDALSHVDCLEYKIKVLQQLLLETNKTEIKYGEKTEIESDPIISTINYYKSLKNNLLDNIREVCFNMVFDDELGDEIPPAR